MGKSRIMLLIVLVVIGIALMTIDVIPFNTSSDQDMIEVKNISQEISAIKNRTNFKNILNKDTSGYIIEISGTNFLKASGDDFYPYMSKNSGALFSDLYYYSIGKDSFATIDINLKNTEATKVDLVESEELQKICNKGLSKLPDSSLVCFFKVDK